jgi:DNA-binding CsgD family transcriptional regulator
MNGTQSAEGRTQGDDAREVILDVEVDGVRYLLVRSPPKPPHTPAMLSPREPEIARMVAKGYPNKTIAAVLDISSWTVGTHLRRIFAKLGVGSRAAMVAQLLKDGLLVVLPICQAATNGELWLCWYFSSNGLGVL